MAVTVFFGIRFKRNQDNRIYLKKTLFGVWLYFFLQHWHNVWLNYGSGNLAICCKYVYCWQEYESNIVFAPSNPMFMIYKLTHLASNIKGFINR